MQEEEERRIKEEQELERAEKERAAREKREKAERYLLFQIKSSCKKRVMT